MKRIVLCAAAAAMLTACTTAQTAKIESELGTPAGQLFCSVETTSGPIVFAALNAAVGSATDGASVIATGATQAYVNAACAAAVIPGATTTAIPVSPPSTAVPSIAVVVPPTTAK